MFDFISYYIGPIYIMQRDVLSKDDVPYVSKICSYIYSRGSDVKRS